MGKLRQIVVTLSACLLCCQVALADGVILNGVSPFTVGRGGTNIAHTDNGSILHDNPAAMSFSDSPTIFEISLNTLTPEFQYADADNDVRGQHTVYAMPEFSYIKRPYCSPWTYGVGAYGPAGFGSTMNLEGPAPFGGSRRYRSFGSLMKLLAGASYQATDQLSFGGSIGGAYTMAQLEGPYTLQGPSGLANTPMLLDLHVDGLAFVWSAGVLYQLSDCTSIGLAYQSESRFHATGISEVTLPGPATSSYETKVDVTWPSSLGLGVRHQFDSCRVFSCDVIWYNWSDAFDNFGITMDAPSSGGFPPQIYEEFPLNWRDTVSVRLGYEQFLGHGRVVRLGYVNHRNPIPAGTMTPWIPAALEHAVSIGYGWCWHGWHADAAYMYTFGKTVDTQSSSFIGGDFNSSSNRDQTHYVGFGLTRYL